MLVLKDVKGKSKYTMTKGKLVHIDAGVRPPDVSSERDAALSRLKVSMRL